MLFSLTFITSIYSVAKILWINRQNAGSEIMLNISALIAKGAMSFLKLFYLSITMFVIPVSLLLWLTSNYAPHGSGWVALSFCFGAVSSALSGYIGMRVATHTNVRTTNAAKKNLLSAFRIAFSGGEVMACSVVALALFGLLVIFYFKIEWVGQDLSKRNLFECLEIMTGFSLGAESIALFGRVAGGIYTKAADVGADIVGKIEQTIPEDDPRNPASIADNVGDNVGDIAGMGADLFGSYVSTLLAAMVLGAEAYQVGVVESLSFVVLPLIIAGLGIVSSIVGMVIIGLINSENIGRTLSLGNGISSVLLLVLSYFLIFNFLPDGFALREVIIIPKNIFYTIAIGIFVGSSMGWITEYFTTFGYYPVSSIVAQSTFGAGTNIIAGLSMGMFSTGIPAMLFSGAIYSSFALAGFYGVAIAASAMMSTTAIQLAIDAFGPIADNAGGLAEMSKLPSEVRERTDILDAVGNTTAAAGKGFAIASAALTSLALFAAFVGVTGLKHIDIYKADVLAMLVLGGMIPFLFSALSMQAVGRTAGQMVSEVRRQFRTIDGLIGGTTPPEYDRCIAIATKAALQEMVLPALLALLPPIAIGFCVGAEPLAAFLAGVMVCGIYLALLQCNAGGAWDNAKKSIEKGVTIDGKNYGKGSDAHKSSVVGDTVGDPFKDTSGPSINILIKLTAIVALLIAPYLS